MPAASGSATDTGSKASGGDSTAIPGSGSCEAVHPCYRSLGNCNCGIDFPRMEMSLQSNSDSEYDIMARASKRTRAPRMPHRWKYDTPLVSLQSEGRVLRAKDVEWMAKTGRLTDFFIPGFTVDPWEIVNTEVYGAFLEVPPNHLLLVHTLWQWYMQAIGIDSASMQLLPTATVSHAFAFIGNAAHILHGNGRGGKGKGSHGGQSDHSGGSNQHAQNQYYNWQPAWWRGGQENDLRKRAQELEAKEREEQQRKALTTEVDERIAEAFGIKACGKKEKDRDKDKEKGSSKEKSAGIIGARFRGAVRRLLRRRSTATTSSRSSSPSQDSSTKRRKHKKKHGEKKKRATSSSTSSSQQEDKKAKESHKNAKPGHKEKDGQAKEKRDGKEDVRRTSTAASASSTPAPDNNSLQDALRAMAAMQASAAARQEELLHTLLLGPRSPGDATSASPRMPRSPAGPAGSPMPGERPPLAARELGAIAEPRMDLQAAGAALPLKPQPQEEGRTVITEEAARRVLATAVGRPEARLNSDTYHEMIASKVKREMLVALMGGTLQSAALDDMTKSSIVRALEENIAAGELVAASE